MAQYKVRLRRVIMVDVMFNHDGDAKSARARVNENIDDFLHMGEIDTDSPTITSLKKVT